jgi:small subunit ribosomal protein S16
LAVRIRMKRLGRRKRPFYRLVAIDSKVRREGVEVERLGWYDPLNKDNHFNLNEDRITHWLGIGAKASYAAKGLFKKAGLSYKWHLEKNGVAKEEVIQLLEEWRNKKSLKVGKPDEVPMIEDSVEEVEPNDSVDVSAESGDAEKAETSSSDDKSEENSEAEKETATE